MNATGAFNNEDAIDEGASEEGAGDASPCDEDDCDFSALICFESGLRR
jgi:hypothetical protein